MSKEFLYVFGYETPEEEASNQDFGDDFESTGFFRILATSEAEALSWGRELSKWYINFIFGKDSELHWDKDWFASWIEKNPDEELNKASKLLKPVNVGEFPEIEDVKSAFFD